MRTSTFVICVVLVVTTWVASAQVSEQVRQRYEAGLYDEALQSVAAQRDQGTTNPADDYLAAQILVKLDRDGEAKADLVRLIDGQDGIWRLVGQSSQALIEKDMDRALAIGARAVAEEPKHFFAQYQLGLVQAGREDWAAAALSFDQAAQIDPSFAYAHYYAGLSYSRIKRVDRTAAHFEAFLKLAPKAPERIAVESILRTLRGR